MIVHTTKFRNKTSDAFITPPAPITKPATGDILFHGIDWLAINFWGGVSPRLIEDLAGAVRSIIQLNGIRFKVIKGTSRNYHFHLKNPFMKISIAHTGASHAYPTARVEFYPNYLHSVGRDTAYGEVKNLIENVIFATPIQKEQISRADLFVDVVSHHDFVPRNRDEIKYLARTGRCYEDANGKITGHVFGKKPIMLRIYNKTVELKQSKKNWLYDLWGVDTENVPNVWRVEYQLRGKFLKAHQISNFKDLENSLNGLWFYLTKKWFSILTPKGKNKSRWPVKPIWAKIQDASNLFGEPSKLTRQTTRQINKVDLAASAYGTITTYAASENIPDFEQAFTEFSSLIKSVNNNNNFSDIFERKRLEFEDISPKKKP